ncbi:MAG: hypothetical protein E3J41_06210 [Candidatus Cloacimonadota bacterium]|nr:MAG: hypothetical protein E3J41_06210 [Candidatus Cloacimonadota bacterium]
MLMRMKKIEVRKRINKLLDKKDFYHLKKNAKVIYLPGGSDREFYRIIDEITFVAMFTSTKKEVKDYRRIQKYLLDKGIGVPEILVADSDEELILMEDVGTTSLYSIVKETADMGFIEFLYKLVIRSLLHLQIEGNSGIEKCKPVYKRVFDNDVLRWESDYFSLGFLESFCDFSRTEIKKLDKDFHNLALSLVDEPLFFMHRDFQSQNIFFNNSFVRIIDFQSAHRGILTYDLVSLLRDAYVTLPKEMRDRLFAFYYSLLQEKVDIYRDFKTFRRVYVLSAIQRNMQALGAFYFLSWLRKKKWFIKAIPQGLKYLKEGLDEIDEFKALREIVYSSKVIKCVSSIVL